MSFKKNVAVTGFTFTLINASTGEVLTAAASIVAKISKDGGVSTTSTNSVSELANGQYTINFTSTEMNADLVGVQITATNAVPASFVLATVVESSLYQDGAVWLDTVNGSAGTTSYVNGISTNPVTTIADAMTIASALRLTRIHVATASTVTLASTVANYEVYGTKWTLALGSQAITGSKFVGATVSGTGTTGGAAPLFEDCTVGTVTLPPCTFRNCLHTANITMGSAGDFLLIDSKNGKTAGTGVTITFIANGMLILRNCYGYFLFASGSSSNVFEWNGGGGKLRINATCSDVIGSISGTINFEDLGTNTIVVDIARWSEDQDIAYIRGKVIGDDLDGSVIADIGVNANMATIDGSAPAAVSMKQILDGTGASIKLKSDTSTPAVRVENNADGHAVSIYADTYDGVYIQATRYSVNLVSAVGGVFWSGITSLADWMRALFTDSGAPDAQALLEIDNGVGTFDPASHSLQHAANLIPSIQDDINLIRGTDLPALSDLLQADKVVDTSVSPWALVFIKKGTGGLGVGTELLRQKLRDKDGGAIGTVTQVVASQRT